STASGPSAPAPASTRTGCSPPRRARGSRSCCGTSSSSARVEELLRHQLHRTRPRDRVEGRVGEATGHGDRRWVLDALDGTANYVRGVPVWATLIALVV